MLRSATSKVMWVGRATVFMVGLAVMLALVLGVATTALGATGASFILGKPNSAETPTSLVSTLRDAVQSALIVQNKSGGPALELRVGNTTTPANSVAPMKVNSTKVVTNLNADRLDGKSGADFYATGSKVADSAHADQATNADNAANADTVDGKHAADFYAAGSKVADSSHADEANFAARATEADRARVARDADVAREADHAKQADSAQRADSATNADRAKFAEEAALAQNAKTLDGKDSSDFLGKTEQAADADTLDGQDSPAFLQGQLIDYFAASTSSAPSNYTGYILVFPNYTPPANVTAALFVRCSYDGSAAGQDLYVRAAVRSPTGSAGAVADGGANIPVTTPGANMSVINENSVTFPLSAGHSYDVGVNIPSGFPTPSGGTHPDNCTATGLIYRR